jgi:small subunit ribosomal protein S11e
MVKKTETRYAKAGVVDVAIQVEKAYQRQTGVFENNRNPAKKHRNSHGKIRYWKSVGLGFRTPKEAINGTYIDKKCPFTGDVSIRGRILRGIVHSTKMKNTIIIRRNYLKFHEKYQRYMKRHKNFAVHCSPAFRPKVGDEVVVGQCRPLSKTVRYNVLQLKVHGSDSAGKKFSKF